MLPGQDSPREFSPLQAGFKFGVFFLFPRTVATEGYRILSVLLFIHCFFWGGVHGLIIFPRVSGRKGIWWTSTRIRIRASDSSSRYILNHRAPKIKSIQQKYAFLLRAFFFSVLWYYELFYYICFYDVYIWIVGGGSFFVRWNQLIKQIRPPSRIYKIFFIPLFHNPIPYSLTTILITNYFLRDSFTI